MIKHVTIEANISNLLVISYTLGKILERINQKQSRKQQRNIAIYLEIIISHVNNNKLFNLSKVFNKPCSTNRAVPKSAPKFDRFYSGDYPHLGLSPLDLPAGTRPCWVPALGWGSPKLPGASRAVAGATEGAGRTPRWPPRFWGFYFLLLWPVSFWLRIFLLTWTPSGPRSSKLNPWKKTITQKF